MKLWWILLILKVYNECGTENQNLGKSKALIEWEDSNTKFRRKFGNKKKIF